VVERRQQSPLIHDLLIVCEFSGKVARNQLPYPHLFSDGLQSEVIDSIKSGEGLQNSPVIRRNADLPLAEMAEELNEPGHNVSKFYRSGFAAAGADSADQT